MQNPGNFQEAVEYAHQLTLGDPENFKQGYTIENAAIAVAEVFGFDREKIERRLKADRNARLISMQQGTVPRDITD